jgi:hypothetical protein
MEALDREQYFNSLRAWEKGARVGGSCICRMNSSRNQREQKEMNYNGSKR